MWSKADKSLAISYWAGCVKNVQGMGGGEGFQPESEFVMITCGGRRTRKSLCNCRHGLGRWRWGVSGEEWTAQTCTSGRGRGQSGKE